MNFASDNIVGGSSPVLQAILDANAGTMTAYGNDEISMRVRARFDEIFEREVSVFFVTTGTAAERASALAAVPVVTKKTETSRSKISSKRALTRFEISSLP